MFLPRRSMPAFGLRRDASPCCPFFGERFLPTLNCLRGDQTSRSLRPLQGERVDRSSDRHARRCSRGRAGVLQSFAASRDLIARQEAERVVVSAVDSLVRHRRAALARGYGPESSLM